ncbi:anthranilate synthase component I family protein, partial [bacterium]|nr:anthranilate synthase component I family protein [bacterium]
KYIHDGDIYQINLSQRFKCGIPVQGGDLYYILREKNSSHFSSYLNLPEVKIGSSSPERFLHIKNNYIETRPIKGTITRGKNEEEDRINADKLANSLKDRAELNMIVDLERNDLGKFCSYGSIEVKEHAKIEKYARVIHSVSTVTGRIKKGISFSDIIKAAFPGGSITGTPKIRAMQIIDELEPVTRGIYTGSLGYIGVDGTVDLNIAIRTFINSGDIFYYSAGGGIVEDSDPEDEFDETLVKGKALEEALKFFEIKNLKEQIQKY